jgi:hypothetical protein
MICVECSSKLYMSAKHSLSVSTVDLKWQHLLLVPQTSLCTASLSKESRWRLIVLAARILIDMPLHCRSMYYLCKNTPYFLQFSNHQLLLSIQLAVGVNSTSFECIWTTLIQRKNWHFSTVVISWKFGQGPQDFFSFCRDLCIPLYHDPDGVTHGSTDSSLFNYLIDFHNRCLAAEGISDREEI